MEVRRVLRRLHCNQCDHTYKELIDPNHTEDVHCPQCNTRDVQIIDRTWESDVPHQSQRAAQGSRKQPPKQPSYGSGTGTSYSRRPAQGASSGPASHYRHPRQRQAPWQALREQEEREREEERQRERERAREREQENERERQRKRQLEQDRAAYLPSNPGYTGTPASGYWQEHEQEEGPHVAPWPAVGVVQPDLYHHPMNPPHQMFYPHAAPAPSHQSVARYNERLQAGHRRPRAERQNRHRPPEPSSGRLSGPLAPVPPEFPQ